MTTRFFVGFALAKVLFSMAAIEYLTYELFAHERGPGSKLLLELCIAVSLQVPFCDKQKTHGRLSPLKFKGRFGIVHVPSSFRLSKISFVLCRIRKLFFLTVLLQP